MNNSNMIEISWNDEKRYYLNLEERKKIIWLSRFGYYISLYIRESLYYFRQGEDIKENEIDNLNDILLQIFGQIESKIKYDNSFPDNDFFKMLQEKCIRANYDIIGFIKDIKLRLELIDN